MSNINTAGKKRGTYRRGSPYKRKMCFIDTEFNAFDYNGQNDGIQEITEIGAVIIQNGIVLDRFSRYCKIKEGHFVTKRSTKITGITASTLQKHGIPFLQAVDELDSFLKKHDITAVYAYGSSDEMEMRTTAKLNNASQPVYEICNMIRNIYPKFASGLQLHYKFSLMDVCRICNVNHEADGRAHSACNDAEDTGLAYYNMLCGNINGALLDEINNSKYRIGVYRKSRHVKMANIKQPNGLVSKDFIKRLEEVFKNASGTIDSAVLMAIRDDMMRIIGRPDLEKGEDGV